MKKKFLITGITGFAGPNLAKLLISEGHEVHGVIRCPNGRQTDLLDLLTLDELNEIKFHYLDLKDLKLVSELCAPSPRGPGRPPAPPGTAAASPCLPAPCAAAAQRARLHWRRLQRAAPVRVQQQGAAAVLHSGARLLKGVVHRPAILF